MKKIIVLFSLLLFINKITANAQAVEDVRFDNYVNSTDNDFVNNFSNGYGLSQLQTNGITGGCLLVPDSINWGNDNANYCSRYAPLIGDTTRTSICFKYDTSLINLPSYQRALSIWLWPNADFNHYIIASVSGNKKLELLTYSWNNNPYPNLALMQGHWYKYELRVVFQGGINNQVLINAEVSDLGTSGTSVPVIVNTSSGSINDSVLVVDTDIHVAMSGAKYGGALYFDDFHFEGREGSTSCINTTGISELHSSPVSIYPSPATNSFFIERNNRENMLVSVFDLTGKKLIEIATRLSKKEIDILSLPSGVYFVKCQTSGEVANLRLQVQK